MKEFLIILGRLGPRRFPELGAGPAAQGTRCHRPGPRGRPGGVVRLTTAVEPIAKEVSLLRSEIKEDRQILDPRLNAVEQRLTALEARTAAAHG